MVNQFLAKDETSAKYFNPTTKGITHKFIDNILSEIESLQPEILLDVGCGTGYITNLMNETLKSNVIGCDMDYDRLSFARTTYGQEVIIADMTQLPFKDKSIDVVSASEIIEHINCTDSALTEIKRIAKRSIIITVPNEPYFRIANFLRGKNVTRFGNPPDHINHYNKRSLKSLLNIYFNNLDIKNNAIFWIIVIINLKSIETGVLK